ncbi:MAG: NYN domain-containing protein [Planctomycetales bacterium]|nr:NYN domain-containing protein [Planctomycetales bacterium]
MIRIPRPNPCVAVLIDLDNIELREGKRVRINWHRFFKELDNYRIHRAIAYKPERFLSERMKSFYLRSGLELYPTTGNSDAWFLADSIRLAHRVDSVIFLTGDICVLPFIPLLEATGVSVEIRAWRKNTSKLLIDSIQRFVPLSDDIISNSNGSKPSTPPLAHPIEDYTNSNGRSFRRNGQQR